MSKIMTVIRNKNKIERVEKQRRREELNNLRSEAIYRARLHEDLKLIDAILSDEEVDKVIVEIPQQYMAKFLRAIYGEDMAEYSIEQLDSQTFAIGRRIINF